MRGMNIYGRAHLDTHQVQRISKVASMAFSFTVDGQRCSQIDGQPSWRSPCASDGVPPMRNMQRMCVVASPGDFLYSGHDAVVLAPPKGPLQCARPRVYAWSRLPGTFCSSHNAVTLAPPTGPLQCAKCSVYAWSRLPGPPRSHDAAGLASALGPLQCAKCGVYAWSRLPGPPPQP